MYRMRWESSNHDSATSPKVAVLCKGEGRGSVQSSDCMGNETVSESGCLGPDALQPFQMVRCTYTGGFTTHAHSAK